MMFNSLEHSVCLDDTLTMRRVHVIDDVETLRLIAYPTRASLLELLAEPRSVTELASALGVPRTRLYHHIELLEEKGLIEQVDERQARALTERVYRLTAKVIRPSARLVRGRDPRERIDALTTLLFETTKADLRRSVAMGEARFAEDGERPTAMSRSISFLSAEQAAEFVAELEALVERFDDAHAAGAGRRPYALVWTLYPSSRTVQ
jgi:DNA-binding transcriptional ArsR family regulator